jgi:RNA polymerase sigma factor (sigma-70 family)
MFREAAAAESTVFIVDDDVAVRRGLSLLVRSAGLKAQAFESAQAFLEAYRPEQPGCLVLDVRMPGMNGLELQEYLARRQIRVPIIIISGDGDVPVAVRAMKAGAVDFIEKPFSSELFLSRVRQALEQDQIGREQRAQRDDLAQRLALLTPREQEVMVHLVDGESNKVIAARLAISTRTVEIHRAKIMEKLQAKSLSEVVRIAMSSQEVWPAAGAIEKKP